MDKNALALMAKETMEITREGFYRKDGKKISVETAEECDSIDDTINLSPRELQSIEDDEYFKKDFSSFRDCSFYLINCDSFQVAEGLDEPLVMNFANAVKPGGGFLNGARAQEESLCRNSTLYASLTTKNASKMYEYNIKNYSSVDSDYMLLSPHVVVFRDEKNKLLDEPYEVAVMTIAAPNKRGKARGVKQETLDKVMKGRLRKFLFAAARYGYSNLVLGAWGCGAFGHNTKKVAQYFYELFFEENMVQYFENIIFAILDKGDKCDAFMEVFDDKMEDCRWEPPKEKLPEIEVLKSEFLKPKFLQTAYPFPICNHTSQIEKCNIGYTQGILSDGMPFEAELWEEDDIKFISFILPDREDFYLKDKQSKHKALEVGNLTCFHYEASYCDKGVLNIGMAIRDESGEDVDLIGVVDYLEKKRLVDFNGILRNGAASMYTDIEGHYVIRINITLEENGEVPATTVLKFMDFPNKGKGPKLEIVK